jgi:Wax ester synthase-like Acyl-CoA acyltransferase domain
MAAQQHLDRLSAVDAAFLAQEKPNTHMHIGALARFEGEPPALDEFLAHIESRLHLVPRYRQKLATPPLETGRPHRIGERHVLRDGHHRVSVGRDHGRAEIEADVVELR